MNGLNLIIIMIVGCCCCFVVASGLPSTLNRFPGQKFQIKVSVENGGDDVNYLFDDVKEKEEIRK